MKKKLLILFTIFISSTISFAQGNCLDFDGSSDYVNIPASQDLTLASFTVEFWVKLKTKPANWDAIIDHSSGDRASNWYFYARQYYYTAIFGIGGNNGTKEIWINLGDSEWHHITGTYDYSTKTSTAYLDGVYVESLPNTTMTTADHLIAIAKRNNQTYYLDMQIDEVRIWNDVRTEEEIRENMCKTLTGSEPGLVAYYRMNETSGTNLPDNSGNGHDGTLTNMSDANWVASTAFNTWKNVASTSWTTAANWTRGTVPAFTDNVGIPFYANQPSFSSAVSVNHLSICNGATLNVSSSTLTANGNVLNEGTLSVSGTLDNSASGSTLENDGTFTDNGIATLNDFTNSTDATATVNAGKELTINGDLSNSGTFTINSDGTGTGSLIINGALTNSGTITSQRYFPGTSLNWHMVSAPVTGMDISASTFAPVTGDFYAWDEPTPGTWSNYKNTTVEPMFSTINGGDNFVAAKGYLLAFAEAAPTHIFSGNLNTGDQTFTLKNSAGKDWTYVTGWNLMGNPYSSAIDWNLVGHTGTSLFQDVFAYAYDPSAGEGAGGFIEIDGSSADAFIAANQGFFVHAKTTSNLGLFNFTNAMQAHGGTYYKNNSNDDKLVLRFAGEQYYDEATIRQRDESTFNKDRVDAYNMNSYNVNAPNIYSITSDNINVSVNSIPQIDTENNIRIGIVAPKNGLFTISVAEASNYMMDHNIYLEDLLLNTLHKISESDYSFTSDAGDISDRFVIHFGVVGVDEPTTKPELIQIWAANHIINIHNANNYIGDIKVVNIIGQTVLTTKLNGNQNQQITIDAPTGYYIINTITQKGVVNKKVYLR